MKRVFLLSVIFTFFLVSGAKLAPVTAQPTCDACGYCRNSTKYPDNWEPCAQCLYNTIDKTTVLNADNPLPNKAFTIFGCLELEKNCDPADPECIAKSGSAGFASILLNFFVTLMGGMAFFVLVFGGLKVMLAKGDPDAMREGKRYVYGAILGLIVVAMSVFIVKFVGGNLLQLPYLQ